METPLFQEYKVNVDNPQKHLDPLETYISFRVTTKVKQESVDDEEYVVRRRYNDFIWLRNKMIEAFPTLLVPSLPGKHSVIGQLDRYSRQFVLSRMVLLDSYLKRLMDHPVFSSSPELKIFLTASQTEFSSHCKAGSGFFDKLSDSLINLASYLPHQSSCPSEFDPIQVYVNSLSQKLSSILDISTKMYKERIELINDFEDAKRALNKWSNLETRLSTALGALLSAVTSVSLSLNNNILVKYNSQMEHPLEEYLIYIDGIKEALARRDAIQRGFETSLDDLNKRNNEKDRLEVLGENQQPNSGLKLWKTQPKDRLRKVNQEIQALEKLVDENHDKLEIANEGLRADLERWNVDKNKEMKNLLSDFSERNIEYYSQSLKAWEKALAAVRSSKVEGKS